MTTKEAIGVQAKLQRWKPLHGRAVRPLGGNPILSPPAGWELMRTAPRDGTLIIIKRQPIRAAREYDEHIVHWDSSGFRPVWRSHVYPGALFSDEHCIGWKPLDDAARDFLTLRREQQRNRSARRRKHRAKARGK